MTPPHSSRLNEPQIRSPNRFQKNLLLLRLLSPPLWFVAQYGIWILAIRLLTLTFITYFTISPTSRFQDVSDAFSSNEVSLMGLSAILFIALLRGFNPLLFQPSTGYLPDSGTSSRMFSREKIEKRFLPGFIQGAFFSGGMILAFVLGGTYRYWGFFIQFAEAPLELANVLFRMTALIALAYCEEFIFREKIPQLFLQHPNLSRNLLERPNESPTVNKALPDIAMIHFIALAYCGVKMIQFDIGIMHLITLYLVSIALSLRTQIDGQFTRAAGFWAAILVTFHPMLSLPLFGNDFSGILLIKYQASLNSSSSPGSMARILSGGAGGPLASFTFQLLMILDIVRSLYKRRKITLLERPS